MWRYNPGTDRLTHTISHSEPCHADYSRALRSVVVIGREGAAWTLRAATGAPADYSLRYQVVYADNPFSQRHWQSLDVSMEADGATVTPSFNGLAVTPRVISNRGSSEHARAGFHVPRNAPSVANNIEVGLAVSSAGQRAALHGFALNFVDLTEQRKKR